MGKREKQKEKRRQDLLDLSLHLFIHKGYNGTTVRDIAKEANISVGLLFHYFPAKQAILEELVKLTEYGISNMIELLLSDKEPIVIFDQIAKLIMESFTDSHTQKLFLLVNQIKTLESIPEIASEILSSVDTVKTSIPLIIKGQKTGEIKKGDPIALSLAFWGAIQGIAEMLVWFPESPIPDYRCILDILKSR